MEPAKAARCPLRAGQDVAGGFRALIPGRAGLRSPASQPASQPACLPACQLARLGQARLGQARLG